MTSLDAAIQIRSLRTQLDVLEAKLRLAPPAKPHTLADLRGMLKGQTQTTPEEIDAVKYRRFPADSGNESGNE
ncbi:MAG: hypothetical protein WC058_07345 [Phycisphaeraceae bacterium]